MTGKSLSALLVLLALAAPTLAADGALAIDARRLTVMMSQVRDIEVSLGLSPAPEPSSVSIGPYDDLIAAVKSYNLLAAEACATRTLGPKLCTGTWLPRWLDGHATGIGDARLRRMTDVAAARLTPFWKAMCDKAPRPAGGEPVCPME